MNAPTTIETDRLLLKKPEMNDATTIFERYAGDPVVCEYLSWPIHQSVDDSKSFIHFSDAEWRRWPAGPFLIFSSSGKNLIGSTGLEFESISVASTGYVLAQDAWGHGFATEALGAMRKLSDKLLVERLYASCHSEHRASQHVLEKAGFALEDTILPHQEFPNLEPNQTAAALCYLYTQPPDISRHFPGAGEYSK